MKTLPSRSALCHDAVSTPTRPARRMRRSHLLVASRAAVMPPPARMVPLAPPAPPVPAPMPRRIESIQSIQSMVYCASIQDRTVWAPAVPLLLAASTTGPRWEKARLSEHDLAVSIGPSSSASDASDASDTSSSSRTFRFVLVAAAEVGQPQTTQKLQRLAARENGKTAVVLFLLSQAQGGSPMAAYQQLQQNLRTTSVSILPLPTVEALAATVAAFCSELTTAATATATLRDSICRQRLLDVVRLYFGNPVPLSAAGARQLVAACEADAASSRRESVGLKDVIAFCNNLTSDRLSDILEQEDISRMGRL